MEGGIWLGVGTWILRFSLVDSSFKYEVLRAIEMEEIFELLSEVDFSSVEFERSEDIDIEKLIKEVRDGSIADRSDYNNLIHELGLIENDIEVSNREGRDSSAIIRELENVGLEFRHKSGVRVESVETVNLNLGPVNEQRIEIFCGGVLIKCPLGWNEFPANERVTLLNTLRKQLAFHGIAGAFYLKNIFYEVDEKNDLKIVSI